MKVKKEDVKIKTRNTTGKKAKHIGSGKVVRRVKDRLLASNDDKLCVSTNQQEEEKMEISNIKEIIMPPDIRQDYRYINGTAETPVLWSSEGILRQALLSFTCPLQEDKTMKDTVSKRNDNIAKSQTIIINDIKLTCSSPIPLCPENVNIPVSSKELSQLTLPPKSLQSGTFLTGSVPLENLPLVPIPLVSLTSGTFSHGALSLMSLSSGPLPPVSEIPRPGNMSSLNCSSESPRNTIPSGLSGLGIVTTVPTTFSGSSSNTSDMPNYDVSQLGPHSLKVLVSLSNVATSIHMSSPSPVTTQTTASSKEGSVTLVYSSFPKVETSILNCQKILPLSAMSEVKSQNTLHTLAQGKVDAAGATTDNDHIDADGEDSISEVMPVSTDVLSVTSCRSPSNISVLDTSVSNESDHGSSSNPIKLDDNQDSSSDLGHGSSISNVDVSHAVSFETHSVSSPDLNHIIIPVSNSISSGKENDHHSLTTQQINQIITIPLTSNAINGNSVGISIPITGNAVPLSMPAQVSSGLLPISCSLLPVSSSALQESTNIHSSPVTVSDTSDSLLGNSNSIQSYTCTGTSIPSVNPNHLETSISDRTNQQHSRLGTDISGLITVTSSMVLPIMSTNSITSVSTTGISGIPVTSVSTSVPSTGSTTMVFATQNPSIEPVTSYAMQSPAEILSQLSKAGVFPTMSSSQVSSVLSALASDTCHLDLESDNSHHVELLTQQQLQVMNLSSSVDKVSTLTQTEDLELGHTVELGCNINMEHRVNKVISIPEQLDLSSDDRLMEQHLHLLNHGSERSHVPSSISLSNKNQSVTNLNSVASPQVSGECRVVDHQVELISDSNTHKQLTSIYPRIVSKLGSCSNEHMISSLTRSDLTPKIDVQKQIIESMGRSTNNDSINNDQRLASIFIKQEDFVNSLNQKIVTTIRGISNASKKRKLQVKGEDANKEVKKLSPKDVELDDCVEKVACYKCKFCPFLTLEKKGVELHVQVAHHSQLSGNQREARQPIKCPGCKNIFFTSKSLRIHLSQDHLVGNEELKTLVELVMKFSKTKNKKRRKNVVKNHSTQTSSLVNGEICDNKALDNNCVIEIRDAPISEMPVDECSKIRVRNLNSETLPELSETVSSTEAVQTNVARDEDTSNGATDEVREGTLVIDDDPLLQQKRKCEFQMIKTDAEAIGEQSSNSAVLCDEMENSIEPKKQKPEKNPNGSSSPSIKKKRGRPKGSKSVPSENYENLPSTHTGIEKESGYRCDIDGCAVRFRSHDNIEYHRRCHHDDKFICPECSQEMIHWNSLSTHLWRYHVIDMELYACDMCGYKTYSLSKLISLHRRIHGDERPFLCDICGKGFKNPKQMRNHKTIHTAKQKRTVGECDVCGRTFTSLRMLRVHKDNVHGKLRPHLCNYCGYSASSRSTLKMHMRLHTGEKPFHCDECEYETADHNSLRRHKMRHSGDKPYKCPHCPYACIQSSTYKAHLNTKHPGLESGLMFSCHMCSFRSVRKDNYLAHVAEHETGGNPNSRQRKHNSSKPQVDSNKAKQSREVPTGMEKSRLPVIINIANLSTLADDNVESSGNVHLIYNGSSVEGLIQQSSENVEAGRFGVDMTTDSVIHLVGELDVNSNNSVHSVSENIQTLCVANIETVTEMPLTPEFEAEQITGDIQDIKEPQELKFKVCEDIAS